MIIPILVVVLVSCSKTAPVYNVIDRPFPAAVEKLSLTQIGDAMTSGGATLGWSLKKVREGVLEGESSKSRHYAKISVNYTKKSLSILYSSSRVLKSDGTEIHKAYYLWIKRLEEVLWRSVADAAAKVETS